MGWEGSLTLILLVLAIAALFFLLNWRRKAEVIPVEIVRGLLSEVRLNLALTEAFHFLKKPKKFETYSWQSNKTRLAFLGQSLQVDLSEAFVMAQDFNRQIDMAKKRKPVGSLDNIQVDKLKEPLTKSKEGLELWLISKTGTKESPIKYPTLIDFLFGGRR